MRSCDRIAKKTKKKNATKEFQLVSMGREAQGQRLGL